ncbi:hypothetical protein FRC12_012238 [Ceratobasidium sp. 428]|nr:hypothetical protein FRC12_012238 [Ceratobasidium sp. 428]
MGPTHRPSSHPLSAIVPPKAPVKRHWLTLQDRLDVTKFCEENPHLTDGDAAWQDSVLALQIAIDSLHRHAPSATLASTANFTVLDSAVLTEQEWTNEEIVDQFMAGIQHANADARGQTLHGDDMDDVSAGDTPNVVTAAPSKPPLSHRRSRVDLSASRLRRSAQQSSSRG